MQKFLENGEHKGGNMKELLLYPIYNPRGVINSFPLISKGLTRILDFTYKDTSMTKVLNDIL